MVITINDAWDLVRYVAEHPELQAELRPLILGQEILSLPDLVRENSRQIAALGEQTAANTAAIAELRVSVAELRVETAANTAAIAALGEQTAANTAAIAELGDRISLLAAAVSQLRDTVEHHGDDIGSLQGEVFGLRINNRLGSYFAEFIDDLKSIQVGQLRALREGLRNGSLSRDDCNTVVTSDALAQGTLETDGEPIVITVEASVTIDDHDIARAQAIVRSAL